MEETIHDVKFVKSSPDVRSCPEGNLPEYAFVGRSNVGKSSLINYLTDRKKLAKTSGQPGRTRLINHFVVNEAWYLVDLPGYGYAKLSKSERSKFLPLIYEYLEQRISLTCLFVLIDSRHPPQENDLKFIRWLGQHGIPFSICFTKTDKLTASRMKENYEVFKRTLLEEWEELPPCFFTSTLNRSGRDDILSFISETNMRIAKETI